MPAKRKSRTTSLLPLTLVAAGVILILGLFGWMVGSGQFAAEPTPTARVLPEVLRTSAEEAGQASEAGDAIILDVRDASSYAQSHAAGAVNIPANELESRLNELDPDKWVIAYCTWPAEESSARAAYFLLQNGFTRATAILGGLAAWQQAGYAVESDQ